MEITETYIAAKKEGVAKFPQDMESINAFFSASGIMRWFSSFPLWGEGRDGGQVSYKYHISSSFFHAALNNPLFQFKCLKRLVVAAPFDPRVACQSTDWTPGAIDIQAPA